MNEKERLKVAKLATKLIVDFPKATNDLDRLQWMKTAIELLNLKQNQNEQIDNEYTRILRDVISGKFDSQPTGDILNRIDGAISQLDEMDLIEGSIAQIAHDSMSHWVGLGGKYAI